jgi:hypothetical protein
MSDRSTVMGTLRVQNLSFAKRVSVRYTTTDWLRCTDLEAEYTPDTGGAADINGFADQFSFKLTIAPLAVGKKIQFCLRYEPLCDGGGEYWDNNDGKNYGFQCLSIAKQPVMAESDRRRPAPAMTAPMQMSSNRMSYSGGGGGGGNAHSQYSHSPSALAEDPWLRYL